jgi:hypothetical protein
MNKFTKQLLAFTILISVVSDVFADRVFGKKIKNKITLNLNIPSNLKDAIGFNLKTGLSYKGSLITSHSNMGSIITNSSVATFQKGNTIYIVPYKNKLAVPEIRQGYSGIKIIIRKK